MYLYLMVTGIEMTLLSLVPYFKCVFKNASVIKVCTMPSNQNPVVGLSLHLPQRGTLCPKGRLPSCKLSKITSAVKEECYLF